MSGSPSMNETQNLPAAPSPNSSQGVFDIFEFVILLARHKKTIILLPVVVAIIVGGLSLLLPNVYKADTRILPPQQAQSGASALLSQLNGMAGVAAAGATGMKNPNDLYIGMLKSRMIADKLIAKYDLATVYQLKSPEKIRAELAKNTTISSGKDGFISVEVEDKDKVRAVKLTNAYIEELLNLTRVIAVTEAGQRRVFFERQLEASKDNLAKAEMALKQALDTHGVISVDSDSRAIVETVSRLRAQIAAKEIQLGSMQAFMTPNNFDYKRVQEELSSLRTELSKLQNGRPAEEIPLRKNAGDQPGLENIKILREVKYHQMLYELLSKQYEMARLDEAKENSVIQVLDTAVEPERHAKPRRLLLAVLAGILTFFFTVAWIFVADLKRTLLTMPGRAAQWDRMMAQLRGK